MKLNTGLCWVQDRYVLPVIYLLKTRDVYLCLKQFCLLE